MSSRSALILAMPCIACRFGNHVQVMRTEEHHLNLGGKAGQKRRGDEFSIPLCSWHHRGYVPSGRTKTWMRSNYGPSLALNSKDFRWSYGFDDLLLSRVNEML